jgi:hypothetical protein
MLRRMLRKRRNGRPECVGDRLDPQALAAIGIDLEQVLQRVEESFGPGVLERMLARRRR